MPALQINVLGPFEVRLGDEVTLAFESLKARALLVYLAVESGRPHSRETVASMLWPDRTDSAALANLRHTLASLRKTLGERLKEQDGPLHRFFSVFPNTIQFNLSSSAWVDLCEFEKRLATADLEQEDGLQTRLAQLSAAVQLYRGSFMEGFSLKGCPEFEDWMLLRRENAFLKQQKALRSLAAAQEAAGAWEQALSALRQLLQLEPWDEGAHRKVMALLAAQDQRSAALSQYERCRKLLWDELGVEPGEETVRLYEKIRAGGFTGPGMKWKGGNRAKGDESPGSTPRLKQLRDSCFVGRAPELARLQHVLHLALGEQGQLVFITGEAGSGKTSLAWEFARQAMAEQGDLLVAAGRCFAITGFEDPFLPFREILQMLVDGNVKQPGSALAPEHLRRLTEAFPETIKSLLAAGPDLIGSFIPRETLMQRIEIFAPGGHTWQQKFKQILEPAIARSTPEPSSAFALKPHEAMARMLTELARHRPLILFVDDLQWADAGSISLLHYLSKHLVSSRVVVVGAYRPQDVALGRRESGLAWERHPLEPVRLELQREFGEIDVDLDRSEGMAFIDALVDREPNCLGETFRQMLYNHTLGNPLFAVELLRSMQDRGHIVQDPSGRWVEGKPFDWEKLPARVEAVVAERIGRFPPVQQNLLRTASVEGETFTAEVVARVLGLEEHQVVSWLSGPLSREQQIVNAQNVVWAGPSAAGSPAHLSRYRFRHFLFHKYLYSRIDPVERSALHQATGIQLENLYGPAAGEMALHLAWHFEQAGLLARAAEYLLMAGKQAIDLSAHPQAKALYDRCLGLIQQLPESPERIRLEIQVQLARGAPLLVTDGWGSPEAAQAANRAVELLEQSSGNSADSSILLGLYFQADHFNAQNNMPEALARVALLLQRVSTGTERVYQVLAYAIAGQVHLFAGQPVAAAEYLEKAISSYHPEDQPLLTGVVGYNVLQACLTWNAWAQWILGYPGRARAISQQNIEMARKQAHPFYLANTLALAGALLCAIQNEPELAGANAQECLRLPDPGNIHIGRTLSTIILGWVQVKQGEFESGLALLEKGTDEWKTSGALTMLPLNLMLLADALSLAGQTAAGLEIVAFVEEMIEQSGRRILEANVYWLHGEILVREQRRTGLECKLDFSPAACFERAIETARRQQARSFELRATTSLARLLKDGGQGGEAACRLEAIIQQFDEGFETHELREASKLLAELTASGFRVSNSEIVISTARAMR